MFFVPIYATGSVVFVGYHVLVFHSLVFFSSVSALFNHSLSCGSSSHLLYLDLRFRNIIHLSSSSSSSSRTLQLCLCSSLDQIFKQMPVCLTIGKYCWFLYDVSIYSYNRQQKKNIDFVPLNNYF